MPISHYIQIFQKLNIIDYIFVAIVLFTLIRGLFVGFVRSTLTLVGLILAFIISANYHVLFSETFLFRIQDALVRNMISCVVIFLSVYILFWIISLFVERFFKLIGLSWLNSILGGMVGILKGLFFCAILIFSITIILSPKTPVLNNSFFYPQIGRISTYLSNITKEDLKEKFIRKWDKITERIKEKNINERDGANLNERNNKKNQGKD